MSKIYEKKVSVGSFLKKGVDIKDGDIVVIANEGKQVEGQYGMQDVFLVKIGGKEGNVSFNQTSLNNLIDGYGKDAINWIGKRAKVEVIPQMGKPPAYYFVHPDAVLDKMTGQFLMPGQKADEDTINAELAGEDIGE